MATVSHWHDILQRTLEPFVFPFFTSFTSTFRISLYNRWPIVESSSYLHKRWRYKKYCIYSTIQLKLTTAFYTDNYAWQNPIYSVTLIELIKLPTEVHKLKNAKHNNVTSMKFHVSHLQSFLCEMQIAEHRVWGSCQCSPWYPLAARF